MTVKEALLQTGRNFRQIRTDKGMSVQTLALLAHVDEEVITGIEDGTGDYTASAFMNLADELNADFRQIMVDPMTYRHH